MPEARTQQHHDGNNMIKQRWKIFKFSHISSREEIRSKIALFALPNFSSGNNEQKTAKIFILVYLSLFTI